MVTSIAEMNPLVSVIVPNYNYGNYVGECIESILNQSYKNIEVIIVDDGSTDNSLEVIKTYSSQITLLTQENLGVNAARNLGILNSHGKYIALCDSDDSWLSSKLSKQVAALETSEAYTVAYCAVTQIDSIGRFIMDLPTEYSGDISKLFLKYPTKALIINAPSTSMFRRESAFKAGLFDPCLRGNGEDWDFFRRLTKYGTVLALHENLVRIRKHNENRSNVRLDQYYRDNRIVVTKMLQDPDYNLTHVRKLQVMIKFELQFLKQSSKYLQFSRALSHLKRILKICVGKLEFHD